MLGNMEPAVERIGLTSISAGMTVEKASAFLEALRTHYNTQFGSTDWCWGDVHERDHDAFVALNEITAASEKRRPVDEDLIAGFAGEQEVSLNARKLSNYTEQANVARFVDGDLVLARNGLNPQIRFAIGKIEGNDKPKGKVTLRLLHVLRAWSNDGHGRPDERLVQANHSGLGNYAEFLRSDVTTLSNEEVPLVLQMSASELEAQLSAQREVSNSIEQPINATIQTGVLTLPNGQSIELTKVHAALNLGFQETGYHDLMVACDEMSKLTGLVQDPRGKLVPAADMQNAEMQYTGPDPIKGLRVIVDVSYIDGAIPRTKLIGLLAGAVQERMMVKDLKCGGVVFGFTTCYRDFRSDLNDSSLIRPQAESLRVKILARDNAQTDDSPVTTH